jgi:DNA-binding MarR family transcriptional regulator
MTRDLAFLRGVLHRETDSSMPSFAEIGLNYFVPYLLNRIAASWNTGLVGELRKFGLTTPQMRTLAVLGISSGLTINELSALTVTEQSTMSRTLDTLEIRGFVSRRPRPSDLRVREVEITPAGREAFDARVGSRATATGRRAAVRVASFGIASSNSSAAAILGVRVVM